MHARSKLLELDVDLDAITRHAPEFSGAQLKNLMNEATISVVFLYKSTAGWEEVGSAVDCIMVDLVKKEGTATQVVKQKELVAYHEAGYAVCSTLMSNYNQVQKISIIP